MVQYLRFIGDSSRYDRLIASWNVWSIRLSDKQIAKHPRHLFQVLRNCLLTFVVVLAATTAVVVVPSANAQLNDGIDRYAPNFAKVSLLMRGSGETEILSPRISTLEQQSKLGCLALKSFARKCESEVAFAPEGLHRTRAVHAGDDLEGCAGGADDAGDHRDVRAGARDGADDGGATSGQGWRGRTTDAPVAGRREAGRHRQSQSADRRFGNGNRVELRRRQDPASVRSYGQTHLK